MPDTIVERGETIDLVIASHAIPQLKEDPKKAEQLAWCHIDFRYFLNFWWFLDQETKTPRKLGEVLWQGQEDFISTMKLHDWVYALKARKLGFTTLEQAWDGWVARFRGQNERVHMFSRREDAAQEILRNVKYGLDRMPDWMKLPYGVTAKGELHLVGGEDDVRVLKAYPADEDTAVEATATHGHVDEWARMGNPERVWQAIEPSMAGTCHLVLTGMGPANFTSDYWLKTMAGETPFHPFFVKATSRPDRTEAWVKAKWATLPERVARREYPMTWKDSLFAGADLLFAGKDLEECGELGGKEDGDSYTVRGDLESGRFEVVLNRKIYDDHEYVTSWDIGRHRDAAVAMVWDFSADPIELVHYLRMREKPYPLIGAEVDSLHEMYPGTTVIEDNAAGEAVREHLESDPKEIDGWKTTPVSKPRMITKMERAVQNHEVAWDSEVHKQFHTEMEAYTLPDDRLVQDSVMCACIALAWWLDPKRKRKKRARARVFTA